MIKYSSAKGGSKLLANLFQGAAATYDPRSQIIILHDYEGSDFQAVESGDVEKKAKFASLVIHEFTHWIDHVSTLWGQRNLSAWLGGLAAWKSGNEANYPAVIRARHEMKAMKYAQYFKSVEISDVAAASKGRPWRGAYSIGTAFDHVGAPNPDHPILFTRFWTFGRIPIARVPMSVGSLLELNAVRSQMDVELLAFAQAFAAHDLVECKLQEQAIQRKYLDLLYSVDHVDYSVAAHCIANSISNSDIVEAYTRGNRLAEIAMNLTRENMDKLCLPGRFNSLPEAHARFLKQHDVGYAYWCLCLHAPDDLSLPLDQWVATTLENAQLPALPNLISDALEEMDALAATAPPGMAGERFSELAAYGKAVFEKHGVARVARIQQIYSEAASEGRLPFIILADDRKNNNSHAWKAVPIERVEAWHAEIWDFDSWGEIFEEACFS